MNVKIWKSISEDETEDVLISEVDAVDIDVSLIEPFNKRVGQRLSFSEAHDLMSQLKPSEIKEDEEARDIRFVEADAYVDGKRDTSKTSLLNHAGFKAVIESVLQEHSGQENIKFDIQ